MCCVGMMKSRRGGYGGGSHIERKAIDFGYWSRLMRCGGGEVGGTFTAKLTMNEISQLKSIAKEQGTSSEIFEKNMPKLYARLLKMAYTALDIQMAKEAYPEYKSICSEQFKGLSYSQRIAYIRNDKEQGANIEDLFQLTIEIPSTL